MRDAAGRQGEARAGTVRAWVTVVILMTAMIFSLVDRLAISLLVDPIRHDLMLTDRDIGLLSGLAFGLFYAFMGLPLGMLADRWSRKGTILVGVGVWSVATAACGLAGNFVQLAIARIGVGAGEAGLAPASYSIIHDIFPRETLGRAMSVFQLGATLGSGLALMAVGGIYSWFMTHPPGLLAPWQATFVAIALPGPVMLVLVATIRTPPRPRPVQSGEGRSVTPGLWRALAAQPWFFALLFTAMTGILVINYALLSWIPAIAVREFGLSAAAVGARYGLILVVVCTVALLAGGWLADTLAMRGRRDGHVIVVALSALLLLPLSICLLLVDSAGALFALTACLHFAITLPVGVAPALIQLRSDPHARSRVSALYVLIVNLFGLGVGPMLVGALSDRGGTGAADLRLGMGEVSVGAAVIAVIAALALLRRETRHALNETTT